MKEVITIRLERELIEKLGLDKAKNKSELIRELLREYLKQKEELEELREQLKSGEELKEKVDSLSTVLSYLSSDLRKVKNKLDEVDDRVESVEGGLYELTIIVLLGFGVVIVALVLPLISPVIRQLIGKIF